MAPLDPRLADYVAAAAAAPPAWEVPLDDLRRGIEEETGEIFGPAAGLGSVEERELRGPAGPVRVRVYRPSADPGLPLLLWLHGGGWVVGSLDSHDPLCRDIAAGAPCVVAAVDYRLAPEHPFPAGLEDAWAALRWAAEEAPALGADPARLAVGGDSAGGNLAAVVALRARDAEVPVRLQVLVYPVTDCDLDTDSYRLHGAGLNLTREKMAWYWGLYLADADGTQPEASPLQAPDLRGLAPALVQTAEYDPLLDEGEAYARRLAEAGVPVTLTRYDGQIHGFARMPALTLRAREAFDEIARALRSL